MKTLLLLLLQLAAITPIARADYDCSEAFKYAGAEVPRILIASGMSRFNRLSLSALVNSIEGINVSSGSENAIARRNNDGRSMARWERELGEIVVDCRTWSHPTFARIRSLLALHEYLGMAGFDDQEYKISTLMWLLATPAVRQNFNRAEKKKVADKIVRYASSGGIIGVGGGGDGLTIHLRTLFLEPLAQRLGEQTSKADRAYVWGQIESELNSQDTHRYMPGGR